MWTVLEIHYWQSLRSQSAPARSVSRVSLLRWALLELCNGPVLPCQTANSTQKRYAKGFSACFLVQGGLVAGHHFQMRQT